MGDCCRRDGRLYRRSPESTGVEPICKIRPIAPSTYHAHIAQRGSFEASERVRRCGCRTLPMSRRGAAWSMSPLSSTPIPGGLLAGGSVGRPTPPLSSTRLSRPCTNAGPFMVAGSSSGKPGAVRSPGRQRRKGRSAGVAVSSGAERHEVVHHTHCRPETRNRDFARNAGSTPPSPPYAWWRRPSIPCAGPFAPAMRACR